MDRQHETTTVETLAKPRTLSVDQAAAILGLGRAAAYAGVNSGQIPALKIGRAWRIPVIALEKMVGPLQ